VKDEQMSTLGCWSHLTDFIADYSEGLQSLNLVFLPTSKSNLFKEILRKLSEVQFEIRSKNCNFPQLPKIIEK
jgi:hypothetical protein